MKRKKKQIRSRLDNADGSETRIAREIRLHLNALARGGIGYDNAARHLKRAIELGLQPGVPIAIGRETFQLVDNKETLKEKGAAWRPARFSEFEIAACKDESKPATPPAADLIVERPDYDR
jgi:hypothetical protein